MVFQVVLPWRSTQAAVPQCWMPLRATFPLARRGMLGCILLSLSYQWRARRQPVPPLCTLVGTEGRGDATALSYVPVASHTGHLNCTCAVCVCSGVSAMNGARVPTGDVVDVQGPSTSCHTHAPPLRGRATAGVVVRQKDEKHLNFCVFKKKVPGGTLSCFS